MIRILICFAICFGSLYPALGKGKLTYYVSVEGKNENPGTKGKPFQTLEKARNAVRLYKQQHGGLDGKEVVVYLRQGIYELQSGFELGAEDSGSNSSRITYTAYPGEKVFITGAKRIPENLITPFKDEQAIGRIIEKAAVAEIKEVDLSKLGISETGRWEITGHGFPYVNAGTELFVNGRAYHPARFPNNHLMTIRERNVIDDGMTGDSLHPGKLKIRDDRLKLWAPEGGMIASGAFSYAWAQGMLRVGRVDTSANILCFSDKHFYEFQWDKKWTKYFVFDLLEELDSPGEYYVDHATRKLYFYPYDDTSLHSDTILVSVLDEPLVKMIGANNITFKNISFEACRGIGIYMEDTENNTIENCTLNNIGMVAVCIGNGVLSINQNSVFDNHGGKNNGVVDCTVRNIGSGGVVLGGGNREILEPAGNYVLGCEFTNCGRITYVYRCPVNVTGVGNIIRNCQFNESPSTAIYLHGNNHIIEYNRIDGACQLMDDMGAFYMGRNPSYFGNIIRYNSFNNIGGYTTIGVYLDDGACGTQVYGNFFYKSGSMAFMVGGGSYNVIKENMIVHTPLGIWQDERLSNWAKEFVQPGDLFEQYLTEIHYKQPPYSVQYPELVGYFENHPESPQNTIQNNVFIDVDENYKILGKWRPPETGDVTIKRGVDVFELKQEEKAIIKNVIPEFDFKKYKQSLDK